MFSPPSHCCPRILTTNFHTYKALVSTVILVNNFKKPLHFFKINPQSSLFKKIKNFLHRRASHTKRLDLFFPHVISYLLHTQPTIQPPQMFRPPHCCRCILTLNFMSPYPSPLTSPRLFRTTIKNIEQTIMLVFVSPIAATTPHLWHCLYLSLVGRRLEPLS